MDALSVFVTTSLPKAGAQVAGLPLMLNKPEQSLRTDKARKLNTAGVRVPR